MSADIQSIETSRLRLQPLTENDAAFIVALLNQPSFIQFIGDRGVRTEQEARRYIAEGPMRSYSQHGYGLMRVESKAHAKPVGMCGLVKRDFLADADIGFAFLPECWSQGFAFEAASAVLNYAFDSLALKRVVAIVQDNNDSSIKLLCKLGMQPAGTISTPPDDLELLLFACER